jgi:dynein heavy chain 1, cytosolic
VVKFPGAACHYKYGEGAKRVYPHAVSLMETVRIYGQTLNLVENNKGVEWLVAEYRNEAQRMVSSGE